MYEYLAAHPVELTISAMALQLIVVYALIARYTSWRWRKVRALLAQRVDIPILQVLAYYAEIFRSVQYGESASERVSAKRAATAEKILNGEVVVIADGGQQPQTLQEIRETLKKIDEGGIAQDRAYARSATLQSIRDTINAIADCVHVLERLDLALAGTSSISPAMKETQLDFEIQLRKIDLQVRRLRSDAFPTEVPDREVMAGEFVGVEIEAVIDVFERYLAQWSAKSRLKGRDKLSQSSLSSDDQVKLYRALIARYAG